MKKRSPRYTSMFRAKKRVSFIDRHRDQDQKGPFFGQLGALHQRKQSLGIGNDKQHSLTMNIDVP